MTVGPLQDLSYSFTWLIRVLLLPKVRASTVYLAGVKVIRVF